MAALRKKENKLFLCRAGWLPAITGKPRLSENSDKRDTARNSLLFILIPAPIKRGRPYYYTNNKQRPELSRYLSYVEITFKISFLSCAAFKTIDNELVLHEPRHFSQDLEMAAYVRFGRYQNKKKIRLFAV